MLLILIRRNDEEVPSICVHTYPQTIAERDSPEAEEIMERTNTIITQGFFYFIFLNVNIIARNLKSIYNLNKKQRPNLTINCRDQLLFNQISQTANAISILSWLDTTNVIFDSDISEFTDSVVEITSTLYELHLHIADIIDKEIQRLTKQEGNIWCQIKRKETQRTKPGYINKPELLRQKDQIAIDNLNEKKISLERAIENLNKLKK